MFHHHSDRQGYGLAGPSLSSDGRCFYVNILAAIEAFIGVLYAGVAGAIMTGKIMRYNAAATVSWSDPMVMKFGAGVHVESSEKQNEKTTGDSTRRENDSNEEYSPSPYPVLEFRVANNSYARGEIANARVQ
ncbi:MAG: hypothetical protein SGARI_000926, partial [Bacillariaceae sp.]